MDEVDGIIEIAGQLRALAIEAEQTYGTAAVMAAMVYYTGRLVATADKASPGSAALWREHFEEVYAIEHALT